MKPRQELVKSVSLDNIHNDLKAADMRLTLKGGAILEEVLLAWYRNMVEYTKLTEPGGKPCSARKPPLARSSEAEN